MKVWQNIQFCHTFIFILLKKLNIGLFIKITKKTFLCKKVFFVILQHISKHNDNKQDK